MQDQAVGTATFAGAAAVIDNISAQGKVASSAIKTKAGAIEAHTANELLPQMPTAKPGVGWQACMASAQCVMPD